MKRAFPFLLSGLLVFALCLSFALVATPSTAQRPGGGARETLQSRATAGFPTLSAGAAQGLPTVGVRATAGFPTLSSIAAGSGATSVAETVAARATALAPTADALRATAASIRATVTAVSDGVTADELAALLDYYSEHGAVDFQADGNSVIAEVVVTEDQVNTALDAALNAYGYAPSTASVDLVDNGAIVTVTDVPLDNGTTGTLTLTYVLLATPETASGYSLLLTGAAINGQTLPGSAATTQIEQSTTALVNAYLAQLPTTAGAVSYSVQSVVISSDSITTVIVFTPL